MANYLWNIFLIAVIEVTTIKKRYKVYQIWSTTYKMQEMQCVCEVN